MINITDLMQDFQKIANNASAVNSKIKENDFIARLVICYENAEKEKNIEVYNKIVEYTKELDKIQFNYKVKENKYIYLLNKSEFENSTEFDNLKQMFNKKDNEGNYKILTINLKNFNIYSEFLQLVLKVLKNK